MFRGENFAYMDQTFNLALNDEVSKPGYESFHETCNDRLRTFEAITVHPPRFHHAQYARVLHGSKDVLDRAGRVGCPHFMAPEVIQRRQYGKPGDVWSAGVLLHVLLTGTLPFVGSRDRLRDAICRGRVQVEID